MTQPISLLIVDDHGMFRQGLVSLLRGEAAFRVVGQAADGEQALCLAEERHPDVVLMDLMMPGMDGVEATRRLLGTMPDVRVLMLTVSDAEEDLLAAIRAGARGYVLKSADVDELLAAIRRVHAGEAVFPSQATLARGPEDGSGVGPSAPTKPLTPGDLDTS